MTASAVALATTATVVAIGVAAPAQAAGKCVDHVYGYGSNSVCVGYIQKLLNWAPYGPKLVVDNSFGSQTRKATINYQNGMSNLVADGLVGPKTWLQLCSPQMGPGIPPKFPLAAARAAGCNI